MLLFQNRATSPIRTRSPPRSSLTELLPNIHRSMKQNDISTTIKACVTLGVISLSSLLVFGIFFDLPVLFYNPFQSSSSAFSSSCSSFHSSSSSTPLEAQVTFPAAQFIRGSHLLNLLKDSFEERQQNSGEWSGTIPRYIHQSWKEEQLPHKFLTWSNSWRVNHPDWQWVLWTDSDNDLLIETHFPQLNDTYWALEGNIFRADFVRNLYMYTYGGMYADLDMECLRSFSSLFNTHLQSFTHSSSAGRYSSSNTYQLALVGAMETTNNPSHGIPNAWMASTPFHPFWMLPLSSAMNTLGADENGKIADGNSKSRGWIPGKGESGGDGTGGFWEKLLDSLNRDVLPEEITGPIALRREVLRYQAWSDAGRKEPLGPISQEDYSTTRESSDDDSVLKYHPSLPTPPQLKSSLHHDVVVLAPTIIYPFSWDQDPNSERYKMCRISTRTEDEFDPVACQDELQAFETGARAITYWSHSWTTQHTKQDVVDLVSS